MSDETDQPFVFGDLVKFHGGHVVYQVRTVTSMGDWDSLGLISLQSGFHRVVSADRVRRVFR